jgi:hypothetical protein
VSLPLGPALAWSRATHEVIAAEAYSQLPPKVQRQVTELLKSHPDYLKWEQAYASSGTTLDLATFIFMRCSEWPDEIRRQGSPYDHPQWHHMDYPLRPPAFPMDPPPSQTNNLLSGIGESEGILSNRKAPARDRAVYLAWLIHLVGEVHAPLHCSSMYSSVCPEGDHGGNGFFVMPGKRGINLHSFWDGLLGTSGKPQAHWNEAIRLMAEYPRKSLAELGKGKTAQAWSLESRALAIEAYRRGALKGSANADTAPRLPDGYAKAAKAVAEKQAALAGYRLADEIRRFLR